MLAKVIAFSLLIASLQAAKLPQEKSQLLQQDQLLLDRLTNSYTSEVHSQLSEIENMMAEVPPNPVCGLPYNPIVPYIKCACCLYNLGCCKIFSKPSQPSQPSHPPPGHYE